MMMTKSDTETVELPKKIPTDTENSGIRTVATCITKGVTRSSQLVIISFR